MAASTKRFTLTDTAYVDVSEGATLVWFVVDFDRQRYNAIRLTLGSDPPALNPPAADTPHYQAIDPGRFQVGANDYSQEVPVRIELGEGDRVFVRAERDSCELVVHRR
jgi:hypothetical protein